MKYWIGIIMTLLIIIAGCSEPHAEEESPNQNEQIPEDNEEPEVPESEVMLTHPLTGVETDVINNNRVIGAVINNSPAARPQSGLLEADLIYEVLAEYEVTRFVALYQSQLPERIGPIRSARPYFVDLSDGYEAMLVIHGWSPDAQTMLTNGTTDYLNGLYYDGTLFERSSDRVAPHNSYLSLNHLMEGMKLEQLEFEAEVEPNVFLDKNVEVSGEEATEISINYLDLYNVHYRLDETKMTYYRYNEEQTVDYETGAAIELANIFIVEATHQVLDEAGRRSVDLESGGKALLIHSGKIQELEWVNNAGRILPIKDGEIVPFKQGQTWVNIIPDSPGLKGSVTY
ncbi:DUF3048 domain-containing protein [Alkalihalobacillus sp. 1P02AB]|uniref:DUF3048 domain-containing protein n=1 Tax=Alkalihalobacillus sp. 1P02AB TaxID=3132260 RepID=UPI0039A53695